MRGLLLAGLLCCACTSASAETLAYRYDALGRLIQTVSQRSGIRTDYRYDPTDNRQQVVAQNVTVTLNTGQSKSSLDKRFTLLMQTDGNLVLSGPSGSLWSSRTNGTAATHAVFQADGNLVVYTSANASVWSSTTSGHPGSTLALQNDGNLVIYDGGNVAIWSTGTGGH